MAYYKHTYIFTWPQIKIYDWLIIFSYVPLAEVPEHGRGLGAQSGLFVLELARHERAHDGQRAGRRVALNAIARLANCPACHARHHPVLSCTTSALVLFYTSLSLHEAFFLLHHLLFFSFWTIFIFLYPFIFVFKRNKLKARICS